mgnify:CR=1 FL=1
MIAESNQYTIYPVVNAQNLSIVDFPGFSDENRVELQKNTAVLFQESAGI